MSEFGGARDVLIYDWWVGFATNLPFAYIYQLPNTTWILGFRIGFDLMLGYSQWKVQTGNTSIVNLTGIKKQKSLVMHYFGFLFILPVVNWVNLIRTSYSLGITCNRHYSIFVCFIHLVLVLNNLTAKIKRSFIFLYYL